MCASHFPDLRVVFTVVSSQPDQIFQVSQLEYVTMFEFILEEQSNRYLPQCGAVVLDTIAQHPDELTYILQESSVHEGIFYNAKRYLQYGRTTSEPNAAESVRRVYSLLTDAERLQVWREVLLGWQEAYPAFQQLDMFPDNEPALVFGDTLCQLELERLDAASESIILGDKFEVQREDASSSESDSHDSDLEESQRALMDEAQAQFGGLLNFGRMVWGQSFKSQQSRNPSSHVPVCFMLLQIASSSEMFARVLQRWQLLGRNFLDRYLEFAKIDPKSHDIKTMIVILRRAFDKKEFSFSQIDQVIVELQKLESTSSVL